MPGNRQALTAIEGAELIVEGQDIKPLGRPKQLRNAKGIVFPLSVHKRGSGEITVEYNPKVPVFWQNSLVDKGSRIEGPQLWGFSSSPLSVGDIKIGGPGRTSSHSGQNVTITGTCFMITVQTWGGPALEKHPKDILLR